MSRWKKRLSKKNMARVLAASMMVAPLVYALPPVVLPVGKVYATGEVNQPPVQNNFTTHVYVENDPDYPTILSFSGESDSIFSDPEDDTLTDIDISVDTPGIVNATIDGGKLRLSGIHKGTTTVTVSVYDGYNTANAEISVVVNSTPRALDIPDQYVATNSSILFDPSMYFIDDDEDSLEITIDGFDSGVIAQLSSDGFIQISGIRPGEAEIHLTVNDSVSSIETTLDIDVIDTNPLYMELGSKLTWWGYGNYYLAKYDENVGFLTDEQLFEDARAPYISVGHAGEDYPAEIDTNVSISETGSALPEGRYVLYNILYENEPAVPVKFVELTNISNHLNSILAIDSINGNNGVDIGDIVRYYKDNTSLNSKILYLILNHVAPRYIGDSSDDTSP